MTNEAVFICPGELAEHWPDHFHGVNGDGPCTSATEPCGYCGETMERVTWPDPAKAARVDKLKSHVGHWMAATESHTGTTFRCECGVALEMAAT